MKELHEIQHALNERSIDELIRLIESGAIAELRDEHVRTVGEYGAIDLAGKRFFGRAFSTGKEVAKSLAIARRLDPAAVLRDLLALRASMTGRCIIAG